MELVYINKVGKNWEGEFIYEFIFSNNKEGIDGEDWDAYPANGLPEPPFKNFISKVGILISNLNFDLIKDSSTFSFWDAVDGLIAIGWENIEQYSEYPENRLFFHFGETIKSIESKLYEKDLIFTSYKEYENNYINKDYIKLSK